MCILNEDDLFHLIKDKEILARFGLTERQEKVVKLHILKGFTFEIISGIEKCRVSRVHDIYTDAIKKIRKQLLKMIKEKSVVTTVPAGGGLRYIAGGGVASYDVVFGEKRVG
jgi:hypothetical protein